MAFKIVFQTFSVWKNNLEDQIIKLKENTNILETVELLSTEVADLTTSLLSDSRTLDVSNLPKVDTDNDTHSILPPESQVGQNRIVKELQKLQFSANS